MNKYTIYHRKKTIRKIDISTYAGLKRLGWPQAFRTVAEIQAADINEACHKAIRGTRPTSVGDVILSPNKHLMVMTASGFVDLSEVMAWRILDDADIAFEAKSVANERAASGGWPAPQTIPDYLFWLEDDVKLQAAQIVNVEPDERTSQEAYARALAGVAAELRGWGFEPSPSPWGLYVVVNKSTNVMYSNKAGEHYVLPGEEPHTYGSLEDAALCLHTMMEEHGHTLWSAPIYQLVPVPVVDVQAALTRVKERYSDG